MTRRLFPGLAGLLGALPDKRDHGACDYSNVALSWTAILMYLGRLGARRQIGHRLRVPGARQRLERLCGEDLPGVPHGDTVDDYLATVDPAAVQAIPQAMVRALLQSRRLEGFRLLGRYYLVTFDMSGHLYLGERASHFTDGCLTQRSQDGRTLYYRPVCEAKLVTRTSLALSVGSEFVENPPGFDPNKHAQDSELSAAERLFPRVKEAFRGFAFCALLDARYCNETGFALCEKNDWRFIITLKEGSLPSVWKEFQTLRRLAPQNRRRVIVEDIAYDYAWVNDIACGTRRLHVLECRWSDEKGDHCFVWVTDIRIGPDNCHPLAQEGGRRRWKTENEGFRTQKHGGFQMEHAYAKRPLSAKNFYLLLQVAHILSQMLECYCRGKKVVKRVYGSLVNLGYAFLESFRRDPIPEARTLERFLNKPIQIRLDTS
ncbi:MAG: hypothetical protein ACYTF6_14820 [Planctomycetota bacterium]|jgi:hypothetical protein